MTGKQGSHGVRAKRDKVEPVALFPPMHVSHAASAPGPKAPPRNKMALYEQFPLVSRRPRFPTSASSGGLVSMNQQALTDPAVYSSAQVSFNTSWSQCDFSLLRLAVKSLARPWT